MDTHASFDLVKKDLPSHVRLIAVSKFHDISSIRRIYDAGQRTFGESRVQELLQKYEELPKDIEWHFIGHLQLNKVKYIAPFIDTIHSIDSLKLLNELNKFAAQNHRKIKVLIQIHIASEEHKFGFSYDDAEKIFEENILSEFSNLEVVGMMGMATFTDDQKKIRKEYEDLASFFSRIKSNYMKDNPAFSELSMGMSDDYMIAIEEGSTLVRIGSKIFGERNY